MSSSNVEIVDCGLGRDIKDTLDGAVDSYGTPLLSLFSDEKEDQRKENSNAKER